MTVVTRQVDHNIHKSFGMFTVKHVCDLTRNWSQILQILSSVCLKEGLFGTKPTSHCQFELAICNSPPNIIGFRS